MICPMRGNVVNVDVVDERGSANPQNKRVLQSEVFSSSTKRTYKSKDAAGTCTCITSNDESLRFLTSSELSKAKLLSPTVT